MRKMRFLQGLPDDRMNARKLMSICNMARTWRCINVQNQDSDETHSQDEDRQGPQESFE